MLGNLLTAGPDPLVEHVIFDVEAGLAVLLSSNYHLKRPKAVERPDDPGLQHVIYLLSYDNIVAGDMRKGL